MAYKKGESGNPKGRPKGTAHADKLREAIEADLPDIITAMVSAATQGDTAAAKLLLDRSIPAIKPVAQAVTVDGLHGTLSDQGAAIVSAMGNAQLAPEQAQQMLAALASLLKIVETEDLIHRIEQLEARNDDD